MNSPKISQKTGVRNVKSWPKIEKSSWHQMSQNLRLIIFFCHGSYQKSFKAPVSLKVGTKTCLKVGHIWFWWFFQNHFAIPFKTQVTSTSVKMFFMKLKNHTFQPFRQKVCSKNSFVQIYQKTDKKLKNIGWQVDFFLPWTQNSTCSLQPCFSCQILTFGGRHSFLNKQLCEKSG